MITYTIHLEKTVTAEVHVKATDYRSAEIKAVEFANSPDTEAPPTYTTETPWSCYQSNFKSL